MNLLQLLFGSFAAAVVAWGAWKAHSLSRSGALGALLVGTIIFGLGGWQWAALLLAFFISSSMLTRLFGKQKRSLNEKFDKGGVRDMAQVLANGGVAALFAGLHAIFPETAWTWAAFAGSLAAVNADTWATELGVLNPGQPRLITRLRQRVEQGTSGGISPAGTLAATAGSGLIALLAVGLAPLTVPVEGLPLFPFLFVIILLAGLLGALFDSLLGATVQAIYHCPQCDKETEKHPLHSCNAPTVQVRGWKWLNNDMVNLACALTGALAGLLL